MNLEKDTWDVINSYFKHTPNPLVRHHIDSYNDFIQHKIPLIFQNLTKNPPFVLIDTNDNTIIYEIKIYYGGKNSNKYSFKKPTIKSFPSGEIRQLFPNEARLKNMTYGSDFFYSIDIEYTIKKDGKPIVGFEKVLMTNEPFLNNIYLGNIPIMLKSDLCILKGHYDELLTQMGEDPYDLGGYFIIDGAEKTIVSQERKAENIIFLETLPIPKELNKIPKYTHRAEIKCVSDEAFARARTVKVEIEKKGTITVRLGQSTPFLLPNKNRDIPLFIMFRALGVETDKQILEYIVGNIDSNDILTNQLLELLRPSILDEFILEEEIYNKESAELYLTKFSKKTTDKDTKDENTTLNLGETRNKFPKLSYLYNDLKDVFFPHIAELGNLNKNKAYYLGYVTRKLLLLRLGIEKDTDRDNFVNKRIDLSGFLMSTLFRDAFEQVHYNARVRVNETYTFNNTEFSGEDILKIINESNIDKIYSVEKFTKHFNGQLKIGNIGQKKGVVQQLDRETRNLTIAHLRRIIDNVGDSGDVSLSRRGLHATQYGCVCPSDTPEGQKVGLTKGLAIIAHITFGSKSSPIVNFCIKNGVELLDDFLPTELTKLTKVIINGHWFGCHRNPELFLLLFKSYRRNGLINIFNSISWERSNNEIKIYADGGRFIRPLYIIEKNNILLQPHHITKLKEETLIFKDFLTGFAKRKEEYDFYSNDVKDISHIGLDKQSTMTTMDTIKKLKETQCIIEYIDSEELNTTLLSIGFNISHTSLQTYTHVELHPSMILSFNVHLLPFMQYSSGPRVIFSSKHVKQGISTYAMNFNNRIDNASYILNYPEKPLITTRFNNIIGNEKLGYGQNVFVAVVKYNYNQEDAMVANQSSMDMGLFGTSHYKRYADNELIDHETGEEHHLYNPLYKNEIDTYPTDEQLKPNHNKIIYNHLDKYGLPKIGTYLKEKDIVIGKYMKGKGDHNKDVYKDMSNEVKPDNVGSLIDHVYTCQTNSNGDRMVKVRTCQFRKPVMGDKFASRNGQKGTFGLMMKKEDMPYTEDGITPDILLDPFSYPKRMTINQFIEILFGNLSAELGFQGLYTPFETINTEQINDILETKLGLLSMGERTLYNGLTGDQMMVSVFSGPIFYERLKYMVDDKINHRTSGTRTVKEGIPKPSGEYSTVRQPVAGRSRGGGLRLGEMERDALLSHGIWGFLKESYVEKSDKFMIQVSKTTGEITISNPEKNLFYDSIKDGITSYQVDDNTSYNNITQDKIIGVNLYNQKTVDFVNLIVPYTFKLLIQEMQGLGMSVKLDVYTLFKLHYKNDNDTEENNIIEMTEEDIDTMLNINDDAEENENENEENDDDKNDEDKNDDDKNDDDKNDENDENEVLNVGTKSADEVNDDNSNNDDDEINDEDDKNEDDKDTEYINEELMSTNNSIQNGSGNFNNNINNEHYENNSDSDNENNNEVLNNSMYGGLNNNFQRANLNPNINTQSHNPNQNLIGGGTREQFVIKEDEDLKTIEELNNNLLGIQNAGELVNITNAQQQSIKNMVSSQSKPQSHTSTNNLQGLNMSFGTQNGGMQQRNQQQQQPQQRNQQQQQPQQRNQQQNQQQQQSLQPQQNPNYSGGNYQQQNPNYSGGKYQQQNSNQVNFDTNIKVVEIDSSKNDGYLYGNNKNLDPFKN